MGTADNILKFKKRQAALQESDEFYKKLMATIPDPIFRTDVEGNILFVNDEALALSEYEREDIVGRSITFFLVPEDVPLAAQNMRRRFEEPLGPREYRIRKRAGRIMDIEVNGNVLRSEDGSSFGMVYVCRDITKRRKAERDAAEWQERYRLLSEASYEGIAITEGGIFVDANTQLLAMLGYRIEDIVGRPASDVIAPDWADVVMTHIRESYEEPYEHCLLRKDGTIFPVESQARTMLWRGRKCRVTIIKDLTSVKEAEERRRYLQAQVHQAQKLESLGTLAGGVAHDFNILLMAIQGYASLALLECRPGEPLYERLKSIEKHIQSGADLTRQLLGFARGGKYEVRPTNINDLLAANSDMFSRTKREIRLHCRFAVDVWTVEVDRGQMDQVFLNMYINAWQAMPAGGNLYVETQNIFLDETFAGLYEIEAGRYVRVSVADTGTGMDQKTLQRIFEPFFTTKEQARGSGLGLASAYGIVRNHGGVITAESEKGYGTTLHVYLPASEKSLPKEQAVSQPVMRGQEKILVVDDDDANRDVVHQILASLGYDVIVARDGLEAVALYQDRNDIDLVVLDMIMPELSGGETYNRIKKINPRARVILCSGYSVTGQAKTILERGVQGFIQKPFGASELSQKIREILDT